MEDLRGTRVPVPIIGDRERRGTSVKPIPDDVFIPYTLDQCKCAAFMWRGLLQWPTANGHVDTRVASLVQVVYIIQV